jgi:hypothetical protein
MNDPDVKLLLLLVLGTALAGSLWYFRDDILPADETVVVVQPEPIAKAEPVQTGPIHPLTVAELADSFVGELIELPPLDDSDSYFLLALIDSFGPDVGDVLVSEALIDKFVATVDNLTRTHVAEKLRPVGRLQGTFEADGDTALYLGTDNYARYTLLVNLVAAASAADVAATYRRFYPLFQESYIRLGYPNGYFNDRVVEVIDHLLQTPEPQDAVRLVRPHVLYEFADPELEALSSGQKLLLRMGDENAARIKQALRELRALVSNQAP